MNNMNQFNQNTSSFNQKEVSQSASKAFMANVFSYMFAALAISGVIAYLFGTQENLAQYLINAEGTGPSTLFYIAAFAPLGLVFLIAARIQKMSSTSMLLTFILYSVLMGVSLSTIFWTYSMGSISSVFLITAGTFGVMALVGYTTKTDLTKFGSILMMGLFGIFIAMIVNIFMQSAAMDYLISVVGVLVFTGLVAYKTQMFKELGRQIGTGTETASKMAMFGALSLYISFVNLFLMLLNLLGNRD